MQRVLLHYQLGIYNSDDRQHQIAFLYKKFDQLLLEAAKSENDGMLCLSGCAAILKELKSRNVSCEAQSPRLVSSYFNLLFDSHQLADNIVTVYADFIINHVFTVGDVRTATLINSFLKSGTSPRAFFPGWEFEAPHIMKRNNQRLNILRFLLRILDHAIMFAYVQYTDETRLLSDPSRPRARPAILRHLLACIKIVTAEKSPLTLTSVATLETIMQQDSSGILVHRAHAALAACPIEVAAPALTRYPGVN